MRIDPPTLFPDLRARAEQVLRMTRFEVSALETTDIQVLVHELQINQVELDMQNESLAHTQLELEHAKDMYQELFDYAPLGYVMLDHASMVVRANLVAQRTLGASGARLIGQPLAAFVVADDLIKLIKHLSDVGPAGSTSCEVRLGAASGATHLRLDTSVRPDAGGRLVVLTDISEGTREKDAPREPRLGAAEPRPPRLESSSRPSRDGAGGDLGARSAASAHARRDRMEPGAPWNAQRFNDLLGGVLHGADLLLRDPALPVAWREPLFLIRNAGSSVLELTSQVGEVAGKHARVSSVGLARIVSDACERERVDSAEGLVIELRTDAGPHSIEADGRRVQHVISNLIRHAIAAVGRTGRVTLQLKRAHIDAVELARGHTWSDVSPGFFVVLQIVDSGPGVRPEAMPRMFDPNFTPQFAARIFDLVTCRSAVRGDHGVLWVKGRSNRGLQIELAFPVA